MTSALCTADVVRPALQTDSRIIVEAHHCKLLTFFHNTDVIIALGLQEAIALQATCRLTSFLVDVDPFVDPATVREAPLMSDHSLPSPPQFELQSITVPCKSILRGGACSPTRCEDPEAMGAATDVDELRPWPCSTCDPEPSMSFSSHPLDTSRAASSSMTSSLLTPPVALPFEFTSDNIGLPAAASSRPWM